MIAYNQSTFMTPVKVDPLIKREQFAVSLRQSKKKEMLKLKRMKLADLCSKRKSTDLCEKMDHLKVDKLSGRSTVELVREFNESLSHWKDATCSSDQLHGVLKELTRNFQDEEVAGAFVKQTMVRDLTKLGCDLLNLLLAPKVTIEIQRLCLTMLINLTFYSINTSITLSACQKAIPKLLRLFDQHPDNVTWLITHLCHDGPANLPALFEADFLARIVKRLDFELICHASITIIRNLPEIQDACDVGNEVRLQLQALTQYVLSEIGATTKYQLGLITLSEVTRTGLVPYHAFPRFEQYLFDQQGCLNKEIAQVMINLQQQIQPSTGLVECLETYWINLNQTQVGGGKKFMREVELLNSLATFCVQPTERMLALVTESVILNDVRVQESALICLTKVGHINDKVLHSLSLVIQHPDNFGKKALLLALDLLVQYFESDKCRNLPEEMSACIFEATEALRISHMFEVVEKADQINALIIERV